MVGKWFEFLTETARECDPLCNAVAHEIDSIGRADALKRQAQTHQTRLKGTLDR